MAVTHYTLTASFTDLLGAAYSPTSAKVVVWIETNVGSGEGIVDTVDDLIALGPQRTTADSAGLVTFANLIGSDSDPEDIGIAEGTLQYRVTAEYINAITRKRGERWSSGWFSLTADTNLADVVAEQYISATFLSQATAILDAIADAAQESADDAAGSATAADASADAAAASAAEAAALIVADLGTTDAQTAFLIENPSDTQDALTASYEAVRIAEQLDIEADVARVMAKFQTSAPGVGLRRAGTTYSFLRGLGAARYSRMDLVSISSNPGSYPLHQIKDCAVEYASLSVAYGGAGVTSSGSWTTGTNASAYNGGYTYATAAGAYKEYTTPDGVTIVGMRTLDLSNAGLAKVSIDGDATRANLLPTAQELVTAGLYANTILVANGGVLNPTDRVYELRQTGSTVWDKTVIFAADLTSGVHVVKVEATGYFHTGLYNGVSGSTSSAARVYISGFVYAADTTTHDTSSAALLQGLTLAETGSAWEYAINTKPTGASTSTFLGRIHGYEVEDSFTLKIDGSTVTPTDGTTTWASQSVEITQTSHLLHPETSTTHVADITTVYTLDRRGLRVDVTIEWNVTAVVAAGYSMMPVNGALKTAQGQVAFNRANLAANPSGVQSLAGASNGYVGRSRSAAAWAWDGRSGGKYGCAIWMPRALDFAQSWAKAASFLTNVQDRTDGITKFYIPRCADLPETVTSDTTWSWSTRYAFGYFSGGADAALTAF